MPRDALETASFHDATHTTRLEPQVSTGTLKHHASIPASRAPNSPLVAQAHSVTASAVSRHPTTHSRAFNARLHASIPAGMRYPLTSARGGSPSCSSARSPTRVVRANSVTVKRHATPATAAHSAQSAAQGSRASNWEMHGHDFSPPVSPCSTAVSATCHETTSSEP